MRHCDRAFGNAIFPSGAFNLFGKSNGIGDIEALCDKAPIEVGNRVFVDRDRDGVQDPSDPPLAGVQVKLFAPGADPTAASPLATTTTSATGQYLFSSLTTAALTPRTTGFQIVVDTAQSPIATPGYELTSADNDGSTGGDLRDSDATLTGALATITFDTDGPGVNWHGYDFGFVGYSLGNRVWKDKDNSGTINSADGASPGVANVTVALLTAAGAAVNDPLTGAPWEATTDASGYFRFDGLPAGQFKVRVKAVNFQAGNPLLGTFSSTADVDEDNPDADGDSNDDGVDETTPDSTGVTSQALTLGPLSPEPTLAGGETDRSTSDAALHTGGMPDGRTNLTLDFGFWDAFAVGNRVWRDLNNNGLIDAGDGASPGVSGVVMTLLTGAGTPVFEIGSASPRQATTSATGFYRFDKVPPGTYKVCVDASSFADAGPLSGSFSSTTTSAGPDEDTDADDDGVDALAPATTGVCTAILTVGPADEPVGDLGGGPGHGPNGDAKSNLTVDFGFWEPYSLGNRVWLDLDNSGTINAADGMSPGRDGVIVNLYRDADTDGSLTGGELTAVATTTTAGGGYYRFDGLAPGDYLVEVAPANFDPLTVGAALLGMRSSSTDEADPDSNVDSNDNGIGRVPSLSTGVRSGFITLGTGNETASDLGGGPGHGGSDLHSNLTLDFGFFAPLSVGDQVWIDADNDGLRGAGEAGPSGPVTVNLTTSTGGPVTNADGNPVASLTTTAGGFFRFDNLSPGTYKVCLAPSAFATGAPLSGMVSSTVTAASPDSDVDSNDDGIDGASPATNGICTGPITLTVGGEPLAAAETGGTGDLASPGDGPHGDANSNLTVDIGVFSPLSIGNRVWRDLDNSGAIDAPDGSAPGIAGVKVNLTDATGAAVTDVFGVTVAQVTTDATGYYRFDNLRPGVYRVVVDATSFLPGAALERAVSSTVTEASPDGDVDSNDNGIDSATPATTGIRSGTITLGPSDEPIGDLGGGPGHGPNGDARSNLGVDFGFFTPLSLGNRVWEDKDNSGTVDGPDGTAPWIALVKVNLIDAAGDPVTDATGATVAQVTTDAGGLFRFDDLAPGTYKVCVDATNFSGAAPLVGFSSSGTTETDPDSDVDANDNGIDSATPSTTGICSGLVELGPGATEPLTETGGGTQGPTGDGLSNLTVDFGFLKGFSLGNRVWADTNNSGTIDGAETGIGGVVVELTDASGDPVNDLSGAPVGPATTDGSGFFRFDNLVPGDYKVRVVASNFDAVAPSPLQGTVSATVNEADPDADLDSNDNGVDDPSPATNGVASGVVTLGPGAEPTGDLGGGPGHGPNGDAQGNLTVDFGFVSPFSVGNRVWVDQNNSGTIDAPDGATPGIAGVKVNLTTPAGAGVTDVPAPPWGRRRPTPTASTASTT